MKNLVWKLVIVAAMVLSLGVALPAGADEETLPEVTGIVETIYRNISTIVINPFVGDSITIIGFPFNNLEAQLEDELYFEGIMIDVGDCVGIKYSENMLNTDQIVYKWESLTMYSPDCQTCLLENDTVFCPCFDNYCDEGGMLRTPIHKRHRPKPKPGNKKPPGQKNR